MGGFRDQDLNPRRPLLCGKRWWRVEGRPAFLGAPIETFDVRARSVEQAIRLARRQSGLLLDRIESVNLHSPEGRAT